jgi:hypothetical protein
LLSSKTPLFCFFKTLLKWPLSIKKGVMQQRLYVRGRVRSRKRMLRKIVGGIHPYIVG